MEKTIVEKISRFVAESPTSRFADGTGHYFDDPIVGFASATDPLFADYKQIIGSFHQTPQEILPSAKTVIIWVLPITRRTRESNRREKLWPSREWALTRNYGEEFNTALRRHLVAYLRESGHEAVAPQLAPGWQQLDDPAVGIASSWSERHAAYAAGLGTFSLNDGLITRSGIAHRIGTVITDLELPPTPRTSPTHLHNCLWYRENSCGACISRCPAGALSRHGHNKNICRAYVYEAVPEAVGERYEVTQTGCGLCQTAVPCEGKSP